MANTKIINIQKNDTFEDVFDIFQKTEAKEVIFIFPKGTKFARNGDYLESIKAKADETGKQASIMTSDPVIERLAMNYGFEMLANPTVARTTRSEIQDSSKNVQIQSEDSGLVSDDQDSQYADEGNDEGNIEAVATLASARKPSGKLNVGTVISGKMIRDIIKEEPDRNIEIRNDEEEDEEIYINKKSESDRNKDSDIEEVWSRLSKNQIKRDSSEKKNIKADSGKFRKYFRLGALYLFILLIIAGCVMAFSKFGILSISVYPHIIEKKVELEITSSSAVAGVDKARNMIPGQIFSASAEDAGVYPTSGNMEVVQKAEGKIMIYNKSLASQRLVATTRFESPEGLIFRIPQTLTVPAAVKEGTKTIYGSAESSVYADRPGVSYNIGPTKFTVPGFKGDPKFDEFFALSTKNMTGGMVGPSKVATSEDFVKAQEILTKSVHDKIVSKLKSQSGDLVILDGIVINYETPSTNVKSGEASDKLEMTVKGNANTVSFRHEDVIELIKNYLAANGNLDFNPEKAILTYSSPSLDSTGKNMIFTAKAEILAFYILDPEKIKNDIRGMNKNAVTSYFNGISEVKSVKVSMFPVWIGKVTSNSAKINLRIVTSY